MKKISFLPLPVLLSLFLLPGCSQANQFKSLVPISTPIANQWEQKLSPLPTTINLGITFYSQAPFGNWDMPYQEACEEASLLLAYYYVTQKSVTINQFETDLLAMINWEINYFGQYQHTTIAQTAEIAQNYLNYQNLKIIENPTTDQLKAELSQGHPIVAPFAGRYLKNPYFSGEGPIYHMLVLRGYDQSHFITNDVGTKHGENFIYPYETIIETLHNWHDSASLSPNGILNGKSLVLVLQ
ncbi:MAG: hypothetical protein UT55_C0048G0012 [Candidatus Peregrinibacteria bacterium GW2011_GWE2_39_6]|nr:MAG: hypothetical protein UT36_C0004G0102 [Candidatus Peregrinibacteria bacterium GW2011_GWF2_39_17]KKR25181.1 MAG: hypothetical protein UT55_C0048G0012 [Candidatus Peregrinibacteria bacterium GW2011_GWE2_39_6]HCW32209.1 hypothetical protein [Candidatus Peregrinibacteria bacterium]